MCQVGGKIIQERLSLRVILKVKYIQIFFNVKSTKLDVELNQTRIKRFKFKLIFLR